MDKTARYSFEHWKIVQYLLKWLLLAFPVALFTGSLVALFLWLLDEATELRWQYEWLLYILPVAGIGIYFSYNKLGKNSDAGNNLILEEIHQPGAGVPARMAPLVLATTVITHLFGGSAGREGTAVQVGGSMAQLIGKKLKLGKADVRILLMTGIAAGFGAVFGTPVTGAIFALEVLAIGRIRYDALLPCVIASILGHVVCVSWGIAHTEYIIGYTSASVQYLDFIPFDIVLLFKVLIAGMAFGLASFAFAELSHFIKDTSNRLVQRKWLIPAIGGLIVIGLTFLVGTTDYLGLGVTSKDPSGISIISSFREGGVTPWSWLWKIVFTAVTLGMGFKGGEVTPLFFIGAALGNTIAVLTGAPVDLFAALGFIAVFAGATNTPLACTLMGVELFGTTHVLYFGVACFIAYYFSGHTGIYQSQLISVGKHHAYNADGERTLKQHKGKRKPLV